MVMALCIYCRERDADSREHWLPQWLGSYEGADVLTDRVCTACNNRLGRQLDQEMARTGPEALERFRERLGRADTDWEAANPFAYRTQRADPPMLAFVRFGNRDHDILMEDEPGSDPPIRRPMRQVIVRAPTGQSECVPVPFGVPHDWLHRALEHRGLAGAALIEIICEAEGDGLPAWIRACLREAFPGAADIQWSLPHGGERAVAPSPLRINLSAAYFRAQAKLAFHYLLFKCPHLDGHDPYFEGVRQFIAEGHGDPNTFVSLKGDPFVIVANQILPIRLGHFLFIQIEPARISVSMHLFAGSFYRRPAVHVQIGRNPSRILPRHYEGDVLEVRNNPAEGYHGVMRPLPVIVHEGAPGLAAT